ncbi:hypothetical protein [Polynucleobacter sp. es-MAR-4]|nr:hypothetical protein [Polynucleobacter sp. es-MAR-4]
MTACAAMTEGRGLIYATQFDVLVVYSGVSNAVRKANPVCTY